MRTFHPRGPYMCGHHLYERQGLGSSPRALILLLLFVSGEKALTRGARDETEVSTRYTLGALKIIRFDPRISFSLGIVMITIFFSSSSHHEPFGLSFSTFFSNQNSHRRRILHPMKPLRYRSSGSRAGVLSWLRGSAATSRGPRGAMS